MTKLTNKVIMITGASSGIGEALVYALSSHKAKLILSARRPAELDRVKSNCNYPDQVKVLPLDLADTDQLISKGKEAESLFGHIDILIHCGGISQRDRILNTSLEVDRKIMEVNYFGTVALTKAILPTMVDRRAGHVVVITSATGTISTPLRSSYSAAKHALHGFFDALRAEHYKDNVKVSIMLPGFVRTQISINALMGDGSKQNKMDEAQDNGLSPEKCAKLIVKAIQNDREEVYIGGFKEVAGIYLKRFLPGIFSKIIRKAAVT